MRCSEIINILEELAPHRMACEWDNPGLLAGRKEKEVSSFSVWMPILRQWLWLSGRGQI